MFRIKVIGHQLKTERRVNRITIQQGWNENKLAFWTRSGIKFEDDLRYNEKLEMPLYNFWVSFVSRTP